MSQNKTIKGKTIDGKFTTFKNQSSKDIDNYTNLVMIVTKIDRSIAVASN